MYFHYIIFHFFQNFLLCIYHYNYYYRGFFIDEVGRALLTVILGRKFNNKVNNKHLIPDVRGKPSKIEGKKPQKKGFHHVKNGRYSIGIT